MRRSPLYYGLTILIIGAIAVVQGCLSNTSVSFNDDIKPLLNKKCLKCHGGIKASGGLNLLTRELALTTTEAGNRAIVPGNAKASELIRRLRHADAQIRMPLDEEPLTESEIRLLEKWINQGAAFDLHWSYIPPALPKVPADKFAWGNLDLDRFVSARMADHGLTPNPPASPEVLVRRLGLDITGLPPIDSLAHYFRLEIERGHVENIVDQLLASPHFGEHLASMWLDLARYADSNGYEKDMGRSVWRFRDWVIKAFNDDLPFDQFTIEQLAGDQLPNATPDRLIATAFHRNTMTNTEGGTEDEEFRTAAVIDRVNTTFEVWTATTMSCVQCHSHPYDPIMLEDYYKALAVFNNTLDADLDSEYPYLLEIRDEHRASLDSIARWIAIRKELPFESFDHDPKAQVSALTKPRLFGDFADDFQEVLINHDGTFSNSAYNANNQKDKIYYLLYQNVEFDDLTGIGYHYRSMGSDVQIRVYLDEPTGTPLTITNMPATDMSSNQWSYLEVPVSDISGSHRLIFHFVNTTGDFRNGVLSMREIELVYSNNRVPGDMRTMQDQLLTRYRKGVKTPYMKDRSPVLSRVTQVFERGNYLTKGDTIQPGVPQLFADSSLRVDNRLAFAQWLASPEHPLTARVFVNRVWEYIFGRGLVETVEDFGSQGARPTHPELLDYLAYRFSHDWGWSVKRLVKEIVLSATYQQSSRITAEQMEVDPDNRWYSRHSRLRLTGEQIRDQALAISGLLERRIGGKSVMPPQPEGVWQVVYSSERWEAEKPEDNYRRSLYTYWKRTTPYPSLMAFDAPSREFCVSRRIRTNSPLQALVTLNDPVFVEAATALGDEMALHSRETIASAINYGFQRSLGTSPTDQQVETLVDLYHSVQEDASHRQDHFDNRGLGPFAILANTIMNTDAFVTKQ